MSTALDTALGNTSYVILGMLSIHPRSGYDIKSVADHSTRYFWAISYGQIYPELTRLESLGYVELESESTAGRARRVFRLSPKGRAALAEWLAARGEDSFELRDELLLKLFFSADRETRLAIFRRIKARHLAMIGALREIEAHARSVSPPRKAPGGLDVIRGGLHLHQAYIDWADEMERELS